MIDLDFSFFIQFVNFIITLLVLNILLFGPIRAVIKKRGELMAEKLGKVEQFTTQADGKLRDYQAALADARKAGVDIRNGLKAEGAKEEQGILSAAGQEAASTLKAARADIGAQAQSALGELKKDVEKYALKATDKILGKA